MFVSYYVVPAIYVYLKHKLISLDWIKRLVLFWYFILDLGI